MPDLPTYGFLKMKMQLCDPPSKYNFFEIFMRADETIMEIKKRIIDHHGRINNIRLYDNDPTSYLRKIAEIEKERKLKAKNKK